MQVERERERESLVMWRKVQGLIHESDIFPVRLTYIHQVLFERSIVAHATIIKEAFRFIKIRAHTIIRMCRINSVSPNHAPRRSKPFFSSIPSCTDHSKLKHFPVGTYKATPLDETIPAAAGGYLSTTVPCEREKLAHCTRNRASRLCNSQRTNYHTHECHAHDHHPPP